MTARSLFRIAVVALFAVVTLVTAADPGVVSAGDTGTICYGLPAKDCAILKTAEANVVQEKSFNADYAMTLTLTGSGLSVNSSAKGTLLFSFDPTANSDLATLLKTLQFDLEGTGTLVTRGLQPNTNQKGPFALLYVDGIYYTQTAQLGWVGTKFNGQTLADSLSQTNSFWDALSRQTSPSVANAFREFVESPVIPKFFSSLPTIPNFVKLKKTANSPTLDGQKQIEFIYTYDVKTLFSSKEIRPFMKAFLEFSAKVSGQDLTLTDTQVASTAIILGRLFTGSTLTITRWVGAKDSMFHALIADTLINYNPTLLNNPALKPGTLKIHFDVKLNKLNQPIPSVVPPPDAFVPESIWDTLTPDATETPRATATPRASATATLTKTKVASATPTLTNTRPPSATLAALPSSTSAPSATNTTIPSATNTRAPSATSTALPSSTSAPSATRTNTAAPSATPTTKASVTMTATAT